MGRALAYFFIAILFTQECLSITWGIAGWPTPEFDERAPSAWLAGDPILGRLTCPTLTRLNLHKKESEALILKNVHLDAANKTWILGLRTGIFWWSGKELNPADLAEYLGKNLGALVLEKGWTNPGFTIQTEKEIVKVVWETQPEFGPYILNNAILWKQRNTEESIKFECVGRFILKKTLNTLTLSSNPRYLGEQRTYVFENIGEFRKNKHSGFEFQMAEDQSIDLSKRKVLEKVPCDTLIDIPLMSAVLWYERPHSSKELRKRTSSLFPREALRDIATGSWSSLPSSLVPKNHPGYDLTLSVPPFVLSRSNDRKPLFLKTQRKRIGLVEKVLSDNLLAGGFDVSFSDSADSRQDGLITGIFIPWPELDLYDSFHSMGKENVFGSYKTVHYELDKVLELYRRSLTQQRPDFSLLKSIHKNLYELELVSVLMQHQACLEHKGIAKKKVSIDVRDPDWFLSLMTQ